MALYQKGHTMEHTVYVVRVILPDGKNKTVVEEEYSASGYKKDENNNLVLVDKDLESVVIEFHNYNWLSIRLRMW
jgi:hypothetical protein